MPDKNISLVLRDKNGKIGWPFTKKGNTVYSYDPGHPAGTDMGEIIASDDSEGLQILYGPPFDVLVERLKLFKEPLDELILPELLDEEAMKMIGLLHQAGTIGDNTKILFHL